MQNNKILDSAGLEALEVEINKVAPDVEEASNSVAASSEQLSSKAATSEPSKNSVTARVGELLTITHKVGPGSGGSGGVGLPSGLNASEAMSAKEEAEETLRLIKRAHRKNDLSDERNMCNTAREYMQKIAYHVQLDQLYEFHSSCLFEEGAQFCPVLIKIIDPAILAENQGKPFLLQVWTEKGEMIFEKPLLKPPANWNISGDTLLFLEETNAKEIMMVKLFLDKKPVLAKFSLPGDLTQGLVNSKYNAASQNFIIERDGDEHQNDESQFDVSARSDTLLDPGAMGDDEDRSFKLSDHRSKQDDIDYMRMLGEYKNHECKTEVDKHAKSVTQCFKDQQLITRAPDKMIAFHQGHIVLAFRDNIIYLDISQVDVARSPVSLVEKAIDEAQIRHLDLSKKFKIIAMQTMGDKICAIVLEDRKTREIRFLRVQKNASKNRLRFVQLGILANHSGMTPSPLIKYRTISKMSSKSGSRYQIGVVLRENGRFEIYSDFILVNQYYNHELQCVDISTDFDQFYFKFVEDSHLVTPGGADPRKLKFLARVVPHYWRNRIGFSTSSYVDIDEWNTATHKRIGSYFALYSQVLNFSMFMLVAHRNMISVYHMTKAQVKQSTHRSAEMFDNQFRGAEQEEEEDEDDSGGQWLHTISFAQGNIRQMVITKRPKSLRNGEIEDKLKSRNLRHNVSAHQSKVNRDVVSVFEKFEILSFIGTHTIQYSRLSAGGQLSEGRAASDVPGRILKFQDDGLYRNGVLVLTDDEKDTEDYESCDQCRLFTFPLEANSDKPATLYTLKMGQWHKLLGPEDREDCLSHDSQFTVVRANKDAFEDDQVKDGEVRRASSGKDHINVLFCRSRRNKTSTLFPLVKEREDESTKVVKKIHLVQKQDNRKSFSDDMDQSQLLEAFVVTNENSGEDRDSYVTVTEQAIKVYDQNLHLKLQVEGLNIRSCRQVHEAYLYTISDSITKAPQITRFFGENPGETEDMEQFSFTRSGFYVYDLAQMFRGKLEFYRLARSIAGQSSLLNDSKFGNRFCFLQSFLEIAVIPYPHVNLIDCIGMGQKNQYMIWREKNGFFTALNRRGDLLTWSLATGKMLYQEKPSPEANKRHLTPYEVYRASDDDITYTQNFYNLKNSSLSLIKSKMPVVSRMVLDRQTSLKYDRQYFGQMQTQMEEQNRQGTVKINKNVSQLDSKLFSARDSRIDVEVRNSQQKSELFHFKVMELKVHEDDAEKPSQCRVRFHFFFELLREQKKPRLEDFEWDVNSSPHQYLYLSKDTSRLMEVVNKHTATVYKRKNIDDRGRPMDDEVFEDHHRSQQFDSDEGQQVEWCEEFRITRFPRFTERTSVPVLFSPNFTYQFDVNFRNKNFTILESRTRHVYMDIPSDLLSTSWNYLEEKEALQLICSRFQWVSENAFRIINLSNVDCHFQMDTLDTTDQDPNKRYLRLISAVKVDNLRENTQALDSPHLLTERSVVEDSKVLERLIRVNQDYKTRLMHAINTRSQDFEIFSQINKINYSREWTNQESTFDIELSFTWLDWRITDMVISPLYDIRTDDIDAQQQLQLCFNIFPKGRTMLHQLALRASSEEAYLAAQNLFTISSKKQSQGITGVDDDDGCTFEVPILPDIYGQTPLDICFGLQKEPDSSRFITELPRQEKNSKSENFAMADVIFRGIKDYGYLHSSHFITDATIRAIEEHVPSILEYMDARIKDADECFRHNRTQREIKKKLKDYCPAFGDYGAQVSQIWEPDSRISRHLFDTKAQLQPYEMRFLDTPYIYSQTEDGFNFIAALASAEVDLSIFKLASVQIIIDRHQAYWRPFNIYGMGLPMVIQLIFFFWWSNIVLPNLGNSDSFEWQNEFLQACLTITAIYLLSLEISSIIEAGWQYLRNTARLLNLVTPALIMANIYNVDATSETYFWTIQEWAGVCIWMRFFLFLGTLDYFGNLIRLIIRSFSDMLQFLIIFLLGIFAFSDAFLSISKVLELRGITEQKAVSEDADFYEKYFEDYVTSTKNSFLTAFGQFDENIMEYRNVDWLVFLTTVTFNLIVLFNLLVAIVSQTFTDIRDANIEMTYREKAVQVSFLQQSLFGLFKKEPNNNELVFVANILTNDQSEEVDVSESVTELHKKFDSMQDDLKTIKDTLQQIASERQQETISAEKP